MPHHLVFFLWSLSFLSGVVFASLGLSLFLMLIPAAMLAAALYATNVSWKITLVAALLVLCGGFYFLQDAARYTAAVAKVPHSGRLQGLIVSDPRRALNEQTFVLKADVGTIAISTDLGSDYRYGDEITADGKIAPASRYQAAQRILGQMQKPYITIVAEGEGNHIFAFLYETKNSIRDGYDRYLSPERSVLLYGIIFGDNARFSPAFAKNLQLSGLRFITAIDGLHMMIVIMIIFGICEYVLPRNIALITTCILIFAFVAITGFTVSGIRSAAMASIGKLASETRRVYLSHNALSLTALTLALINPSALVFDVGFQLSFLAVISIVYLMPVLSSLLHLREGGFLDWRTSLLITLSVQLMSAPLIFTQFQTFSLTSFIASVLLVWMLPYLIMSGFLLAAVSFISPTLSVLTSWLALPLIDYVTLLVNSFAKLSVLFNPDLGFTGAALYYAALVALLYWFYYWHQKEEEDMVREEIVAAPITLSPEAAAYTIIEVE